MYLAKSTLTHSGIAKHAPETEVQSIWWNHMSMCLPTGVGPKTYTGLIQHPSVEWVLDFSTLHYWNLGQIIHSCGGNGCCLANSKMLSSIFGFYPLGASSTLSSFDNQIYSQRAVPLEQGGLPLVENLWTKAVQVSLECPVLHLQS